VCNVLFNFVCCLFMLPIRCSILHVDILWSASLQLYIDYKLFIILISVRRLHCNLVTQSCWTCIKNVTDKKNEYEYNL
jgi:hypothetical protein